MQHRPCPKEMNNQIGQMTWRPYSAVSCGILHLRLNPTEQWKPYTEFPQYFLPDLDGFSEGYATFLSLLKQNWQAV